MSFPLPNLTSQSSAKSSIDSRMSGPQSLSVSMFSPFSVAGAGGRAQASANGGGTISSSTIIIVAAIAAIAYLFR